jgi:hypothetical protein
MRLRRMGELPADHTVLINLTGSDRDARGSAAEPRWLRRSAAGWVPEDDRSAVVA